MSDIIKRLRSGIHEFEISSAEITMDAAADEIEKLRAERDALKAENDQHKSVYQKYVEATDRMNGTPCEQVRHHYEVSELRAELALAVSERDTLLARLAPVEDEALVERERCAKIASGLCESCGGEGWLWAHELGIGLRNDDTKYSCDGQGESIACKIAAAIRRRND